MLRRLGEDKYDQLQQAELKTFPIIAAVLEKHQSGAVYVDSNTDPQMIFIISRSGFSYLYTRGPQPDYAAFIRFLEQEPAVPQYFHMYDAPQDLTGYAMAHPETLGCKLRERVQLQYQKPGIEPQAYYPAVSMEASEIDADNIATLAPLGLDIENKFWNDKAHFINGGYGVFLHQNGSVPAAVCYAAAIGNGLAEVDILTSPDHQKKGLAKYAAAQFIRQGLERGIGTNWDCFRDNQGSLNTALALGFTPVKNYSLLSLFLKGK